MNLTFISPSFYAQIVAGRRKLTELFPSFSSHELVRHGSEYVCPPLFPSVKACTSAMDQLEFRVVQQFAPLPPMLSSRKYGKI